MKNIHTILEGYGKLRIRIRVFILIAIAIISAIISNLLNIHLEWFTGIISTLLLCDIIITLVKRGIQKVSPVIQKEETRVHTKTEHTVNQSSNTKKCYKCFSDMDTRAIKCPHCQTDQRSWVKKNPFLSLILGLVLFGILMSNIIPPLTRDIQENITPISTPPGVSLTEKLKRINNDPYWTSTEPADYSDTTKLQIQSILFSTYASVVLEGEKSSSEEDKKLAVELKKKLIAKQIAEYPKMRKAYAEFADTTMWEANIDATVSGTNNATLTFIGGSFASNKNVLDVHTKIVDMLKELRFKRVNYKWIPSDETYTYWDIESAKDSELITVPIEN